MYHGRFAAAVLGAALCSSQSSHATVLYSNGPLDGETQGWTINNDFLVADSFTLVSAATITGADFGAWFFQGDFGLTIEWQILDASPGAGGNVLASSAGPVIQNNSISHFTNASGFDVYTESIVLTPTPLAAGTYWLALFNAVTSYNIDFSPLYPEYWDQNGGPSQAYQADLLVPANSIGNIPSETFSITGTELAAQLPEPSSLAFLGAGLLGLVIMRRRRRPST